MDTHRDRDSHPPREKPYLVYVLPAYGEAAVIGAVIQALREKAPPGEIVVVDDGSRDATGRIAAESGATLLVHALNRGQGAALQTGLSYARGRGADVAVTFDSDGQHSPEDVAALIEPVLSGACDVTLGSRFLEGAAVSNMPPVRRLTLRLGVLFTRLVSQLPVTDTHNGLRALGRLALEKIELHLDGMAHASELIDQVRKNRLRFREVPCRIAYSEYSLQKGQSSRAALRIAGSFLLEKLRS